jgi:hypothetical protein
VEKLSRIKIAATFILHYAVVAELGLKKSYKHQNADHRISDQTDRDRFGNYHILSGWVKR